jgi:tripartite-type tricarboxylate transporter receptor subunit TctC
LSQAISQAIDVVSLSTVAGTPGRRPYKGGGQTIGDVVAGHVPMTITSVQATKSLVEGGKRRLDGARLTA